MARSHEHEIALLDKRIAQMGGLAESLLGQAFEALERRNPQLAHTAVQADKAIDGLQKETEEQAISMIARRQPMAHDLWHIIAVLRITGELERIGDRAKNIAKRALTIAPESCPRHLLLGLRHMVEQALRQLKDVLDAYAERDSELALNVWRADEQIDSLYNSVFRELVTSMMQDSRDIGLCAHLLFSAKNLERIGDHTTNVAETVYYLVHGVSITGERPKDDQTSSTPISRQLDSLKEAALRPCESAGQVHQEGLSSRSAEQPLHAAPQTV
jgi:phosphate transport system protein